MENVNLDAGYVIEAYKNQVVKLTEELMISKAIVSQYADKIKELEDSK